MVVSILIVGLVGVRGRAQLVLGIGLPGAASRFRTDTE